MNLKALYVRQNVTVSIWKKYYTKNYVNEDNSPSKSTPFCSTVYLSPISRLPHNLLIWKFSAFLLPPSHVYSCSTLILLNCLLLNNKIRGLFIYIEKFSRLKFISVLCMLCGFEEEVLVVERKIDASVCWGSQQVTLRVLLWCGSHRVYISSRNNKKFKPSS